MSELGREKEIESMFERYFQMNKEIEYLREQVRNLWTAIYDLQETKEEKK